VTLNANSFCSSDEDMWGSAVISPLILVHGTKRREWLALGSGRFIPGDSPSIHVSVPDLVWALWRRKRFLA